MFALLNHIPRGQIHSLGLVFDLDFDKLSNVESDNVRLFDSLESLEVTFMKCFNRERSFFCNGGLMMMSMLSPLSLSSDTRLMPRFI